MSNKKFIGDKNHFKNSYGTISEKKEQKSYPKIEIT